MKKNIVRILSLILVAAFLLSGCEVVPETPATQLAESVQTAPVETTEGASQPGETTLPPETTEKPTEAAIEEETAPTAETTPAAESPEETPSVFEEGEYTTKDEVALYLHLFGHLPSNYITKKEAQNLGWVSKDGNLWDVAPGKSIGGDRFGNYEGILPKGHSYFECDIDFPGDYRNAKRIIFSTDGLIYYTEDHYSSFELLYGEES